jgi:hypothetical protein
MTNSAKACGRSRESFSMANRNIKDYGDGRIMAGSNDKTPGELLEPYEMHHCSCCVPPRRTFHMIVVVRGEETDQWTCPRTRITARYQQSRRLGRRMVFGRITVNE